MNKKNGSSRHCLNKPHAAHQRGYNAQTVEDSAAQKLRPPITRSGDTIKDVFQGEGELSRARAPPTTQQRGKQQ